MSIDHCREVQEGRIDVEEFISDVLEKTKQINKEHNFFTVI